MNNPDRFTRVRRVAENIFVLGVTTLGLAGSAKARPSSWYYWWSVGFDPRGCASVWIMQSHEITTGEHVALDIVPNGAKSIEIDISGKPFTLYERKVCVSGDPAIIFSAKRDGVQSDPSVMPPTP